MKRFIYTTGILTVILLSGCRFNNFLVDSDFNYDGKFADYQTFGFFEFDRSGLDPYYTQRVQDMVIKRLTSLGYGYNPDNPDLRISFKYLDEDMTFSGYNQTNLNAWVYEKGLGSDLRDKNGQYEKDKIRLPSGSLMLYMMESKDSQLVWLGYSSMYDIALHERNLLASVGLILDKYNVTRY